MAEPASPPSLDPEGCQLRLANPPGDLDDHTGPAYVHVHGGLLRIAASGTTLLPESFVGVTRVLPGLRGEVWLADDGGVRVIDPGSSGPRPFSPGVPGLRPDQISVGSYADLWGLWVEGEWAAMKSWEIVHHDQGGVQRRAGSTFTGPDARPLPDSIASTSAGLWLSTSNGLWRGSPDDWERVEPEAPRSLAASGERLVGVLEHGRNSRIVVREGDAWRSLSWRPDDGTDVIRIQAVSPSGLIVWGVRNALWIGSLDGDCEAIALEPVLQGRWVLYVAIDGRNRVWLSTEHGLVVLDRAGRVLADYLPFALPGLKGAALGLAVPTAGPEVLPVPAPRRRVDVVGQLIAGRYAPIAGAAVRIRVGTLLERETVTDAIGMFRLTDVPEGSYQVEVTPRPGTPGCHFRNTLSDFTLQTAIDCPVDGGAAACEIGQRRPCRDGGPML